MGLGALAYRNSDKYGEVVLKGTRFWLAASIIDRRAISLVVLSLVTAFFFVGALKVELKTIFSDLLPKNHPFVRTYIDHPNFGNPLTVTVMVKRVDGDIYNPETLEKVWNITRDIDRAPGVDHDQILSIATEKARFTEATPFGIDSQPLMADAPPATGAELQQFRKRVNKSPSSRRFLISQDERSTLITATFIERLLDYGESFDFIQAMAKSYEDESHEIYVAGQPILTGWVYQYERQMLWIFAVTVLALLLALVVYMRNVPGVIAPLVTSVVAAIWGFGFVGWLGSPIEPLIMVVPLLLVARSFSHCVQFIERFYEINAHVEDRREAAKLTLGVMMAPGVLGIVTDAIGLFLIAVAPIPVMERFAIFCGFWALILVPTNVCLTPLLLTLLPAPKNLAKIVAQSEEGHGLHQMIRRGLMAFSSCSYGSSAKYTALVIVAMTVGSIVLLKDMKVGNPVEGSSLLWDDSQYNTAVAQINGSFPGLNTLEIIFEAKDQNSENRVARQMNTVLSMLEIQRYIESQENPPEATLSFADFLPEANRLYSGGSPKWAPLDHTVESIRATASAAMIGTNPKAFLHVTDFVQQNATVSLWYKDNKQETVDLALDQAKTAVESVGTDHEQFVIRLASGTMALQQSINETVHNYQWVILALLNLVIFITCSFSYRSFVAGILLLVPVNLSNLLLGATMVKMDIGLDVNTLPIASIGIGVGIDYGIYLLSRICEEYQACKDHRRAIRAAVSTTGKAVFFTATIVLIGIFPWYFLSDLKFLADMGLLLVMVMLINMVIALVVVPLLTWLIKPRFLGSGEALVVEGLDLAALRGLHVTGESPREGSAGGPAQYLGFGI